MTHSFIDRPIFATVLSVFLTLIGLGALAILPISQYPEIVPPTVQITTQYPGASAETVSRTVATPLEQEINGVENMIYINSQSTGDGKLTVTVTFRIGTDLNVAQMLTQNRVQDALPRLPEDVQRLGVQVRKATPNILLAVHLYSPDASRDTLYISNYATLHVKDVLARLPGVGDVQIFGGRDYAMRIWLDPDKVAAHNMNASEVLAALRAQNVQVSAGVLNQPPIASKQAYQLNVQTLGRLSTPEEFASIVLKSDNEGRVTRLRDVGRVEIGAADYGSTAFMDRGPGMPLLIFAQPGANSLAVEHEVLDTIQTLAKDFPPGLQYKVIYDPTIFVGKSVDEVIKTIFIAILLVVGVVFLFLQSWRAAIIPVIAIPVSLVGTFTFLYALGISLNNLSLFGLVLAVGIVVDDAIVVVENVERNLERGMSPKEAAHVTMSEVGGALISIALTLCAVFVPSAFLSGITGQFFRQFAITIAASTLISCFVSLTLSPALCAVLFKAHEPGHKKQASWIVRLVQAFFARFNHGFEWLSTSYGRLTKRLVQITGVVLVVYAALIGLAGFQFARAPTGFIPEQDQGYLITVVQLPPGATLERTEAVVKKAIDIILSTPGVEHVAPFAGLDATTFTIASNAGTIFSGLPSLYNHEGKDRDQRACRSAQAAVGDPGSLCADHPAAAGAGPRQCRRLQDDGAGPRGPRLRGAVESGADAGRCRQQGPELCRRVHAVRHALALGLCRYRSRESREGRVDADRRVQHAAGLSRLAVCQRLQLSRPHLPGDRAGRRPFRQDPQDIARLKARNGSGEMVPVGTVARLQNGERALSCPSLRLVPRRRSDGRRGTGRCDRHCAASRWRSSRAKCCRPASASNGPSSPSSSNSRAPPRCWCSVPPRCSCSWCWPRNMRAGSCRLRSC